MTTLIEQAGNTIKNWWIPFIVGIGLIILGIYTLSQPDDGYDALTYVFAISFLIIGILEIYFAFTNKETMDNWGWLLFFGIITTIVGILMISNIDVAAQTLPYYVGFLFLFRSVAIISYSIDLNDSGTQGWGWVLFLGILGVVFSFVLLWNPEFAGLTAVVWTGLALIFGGTYMLYVSLQLRHIKRIPNRINRQVNDAVNSVSDNS